MTERTLRNGQKIFMIYIPPTGIFEEELIEIKTCFKCFSLDSHNTHECLKDSSYIIYVQSLMSWARIFVPALKLQKSA